MSDVRKVLILSVRAGAGHIRAAQAVEQRILARYPSVDVRHLDALTFSNPVFAKNFASSYETIARSLPSVWGMIYDAFEDRVFERNVKIASRMFDSFNVQNLLKEIKAYDPDRIICTHYLPAEALAPRRRKGKLRASLSVVITDYDVHTMWLQNGIDRYFVASDEMKYALQRKLPYAADICITGIPVRDEFSCEYPSPSDMRKKLGFLIVVPYFFPPAGSGLYLSIVSSGNSLSRFPISRFLRSRGKMKSWRKSSGMRRN